VSTPRLAMTTTQPIFPVTPSDWRQLFELGAAHGVLDLVGPFIERAPAGVPDDVRRAFRTSSLEAGARYLLFANQLHRAMEVLACAGASALAVKGPVLARILDPAAPERRPCVDLDVLVRPNDVLDARDALREIGYQERHPFPRGHEERCLEVGNELVLDRPGHASIDLHWRLTLPFGALGGLEARLWERATRVDLEGTSVPTLCAEDHLLFLCVHGCGHGWSRLRWVADVAGFLQVHPELDTTALVRTANETSSLHLLLAGLDVARRLLDAPLNGALTRLLNADPLARAAARWYADRLFAPDQPWARRAWLTLLRQGLRNRIYEALGALLTPTDVEWTSVRLPPALFGLYRGVRVGRLLTLALRRSPSAERALGDDGQC
jgi:hypothetical protein